jgi:hypothetical protein
MCSSNAKCVDLNMVTDGEPYRCELYRCECKDGYHGTSTTCCDTKSELTAKLANEKMDKKGKN